ncbi:T9SS type A sorting domain-containing protein [Chitinophaga nivalis]|uniref:T9SS type A sorting domain-containing protein n=1 Tax=Chitinophaga nivalis TaxID=2991709 RepID=A0ABT3IMX3_9BACT|nr:T9SS type A sorting domain-containing protein [Chitinophaga nivalis]MCW3465011.1 T9SS type A sorting domain-containing protein [Chitinophaga nivalis]MCW3485297.1 T9SS type A sorting domain-containing protein [Chitinophaga nivalis]
MGCLITSFTAIQAQSILPGLARIQTYKTDGLCVGCLVAQPELAVDTSSTTYSQLKILLGLLGAYAQQTLTFPSTGSTGSTVTLLLSFPATVTNPLQVGNVEVATYLNGTFNNDRRRLADLDMGIFVMLLEGNKVMVFITCEKPFNQLEVRLTSGLQLIGSVNIHYAAQEVPAQQVAGNLEKMSDAAIFASPALYNHTIYAEAAARAGSTAGAQTAAVEDWQLFPNPFSTQLSTRFTLRKQARVTITLYPVNGARPFVLTDQVRAPGVYQIPLTTAKLPAGQYICKIMAGQEVHTQQVIKPE